MIVIVDYKIGNTASIANSLRRVTHIPVVISSSAVDVRQAQKIILPGVGTFAEAVKNLRDSGLFAVLTEQITRKCIPTLGICLGMHLLGDMSEEGEGRGLGVISSSVQKFPAVKKGSRFKVPHIGWNSVHFTRRFPSLFSNISSGERFYFSHSYHSAPANPNVVRAQTDHMILFPSVVAEKNVIGTQFHPEKSHDAGMQLLRNFINS